MSKVPFPFDHENTWPSGLSGSMNRQKEFRNDLMDTFSEDAFKNRREYICGFYRGEHGELYREYPYLAPEQADGFVGETVEKVYEIIHAGIKARNGEE